MNVVIDTNIIFSAILSSKGKIHDLILNSYDEFTFFTPTFLIEELDLHHLKIKQHTGFSDSDISFLKLTLFHHIEFIDPRIIRQESWRKAAELVADIDQKDTPFVALALEINGQLWTGDKKLCNGLKTKNINWTLTTDDLFEKRNK